MPSRSSTCAQPARTSFVFGRNGFEAPQASYRWQSGVSLPTVDNLYALSILLNVTMEDILIVRNRSVCEQQAELDCSVFLFMAIHRFSWKNSCLNRREAARD